MKRSVLRACVHICMCVLSRPHESQPPAWELANKLALGGKQSGKVIMDSSV